jgi:hypothetical protein
MRGDVPPLTGGQMFLSDRKGDAPLLTEGEMFLL